MSFLLHRVCRHDGSIAQWRAPPLAPLTGHAHWAVDQEAGPRLQRYSWRLISTLPYTCQAKPLQREISNIRMADAADTLSESTRPRTGIDTSASQVEATRGLSPLPSAPITRTT